MHHVKIIIVIVIISMVLFHKKRFNFGGWFSCRRWRKCIHGHRWEIGERLHEICDISVVNTCQGLSYFSKVNGRVWLCF